MSGQAQLLPGTLDLLILKAVSLGPLHGYGILLRIGQISAQALLIEQGALYPGLFRLVRQGLLKAKWGTSENNRRARYYSITPAGRKQLAEEEQNWAELTDAVTRVLIETSDGVSSWVTVGVGANVVEASWDALLDGVVFGLRRSELRA